MFMLYYKKKNSAKTNGLLVLADFEPVAQHISAFNCGHFSYDFWFQNKLVFCLLGGSYT
jgi:hypothetical protein